MATKTPNTNLPWWSEPRKRKFIDLGFEGIEIGMGKRKHQRATGSTVKTLGIKDRQIWDIPGLS